MAAIGELSVLVTASTEKFVAALNRARRHANRFDRVVGRKLTGSISKLGRSLSSGTAFLLGFSSAAAAVTRSIELASQLETLSLQFETLTGNAEKAGKVMDQLRKFSAKTPFKFRDIADAGRSLIAFGVGTDDVLGRVKMLGDISAASGARLSELVSIFGKMRSSGVVSLGDINQLGDRQIPIFEELKKQLGLSGIALRKFVSDGKLGFDDVSTALETMTAKGGMFSGALDRLSQSTAGKFSTLSDNVDAALTKIGKAFIENLNLNKFIDDLTTLAQVFARDIVPQISKATNDLVRTARALASQVDKFRKSKFETERKKIVKESGQGLFDIFSSKQAKLSRRLEAARVAERARQGMGSRPDDDVAQIRAGIGRRMPDAMTFNASPDPQAVNEARAARQVQKEFAQNAKRLADLMKTPLTSAARRIGKGLGGGSNIASGMIQSLSSLSAGTSQTNQSRGNTADFASAVFRGSAEASRIQAANANRLAMNTAEKRDETRNKLLSDIVAKLTELASGANRPQFDLSGMF